MKLHTLSSVTERRQIIEKKTKTSLPTIGTFSLDETIASTRHCENMIGATQVPLGIAGPLCIDKTEYYILALVIIVLITYFGWRELSKTFFRNSDNIKLNRKKK